MQETFTAYTEANMSLDGYTRIVGRSTLYRHPRYPGFVFKRVPTLGAAVAAGGVMLRTGAAGSAANAVFLEQILLGRTAFNTYHAGQLGKIAYPNVITAHIAGEGATWNSTSGRSTHGDSVLRFSGVGWQNHGQAARGFLAVISTASAGYLLFKNLTTYDETNLSPLANYGSFDKSKYIEGPIGEAIIRLDWANNSTKSAALTDGKFVVSQDWNTAFRLSVPRVSGFMSQSFNVNARQVLSKGKADLIAAVDADIAPYYASAWDQTLNEVAPSSLLISDAVAIYPFMNGESVQWAFGKPAPMGAMTFAQNLYPTAVKTIAGTYTADAQPTPTQKAAFVIPQEMEYRGFGLPGYALHPTATQNTAVVAAGVAPERRADGTTARTTFRLDQVPYRRVQLSDATTAPASGVFGVFGPGTSPGTVPAGENADLIDIRGRINAELSHLDVALGGQVVSVAQGATPAVQEAAATSNERTANLRRSATLALVDAANPLPRLVATFVAKLDDRVQNSVGA